LLSLPPLFLCCCCSPSAQAVIFTNISCPIPKHTPPLLHCCCCSQVPKQPNFPT
jgi:hypothetical protein